MNNVKFIIHKGKKIIIQDVSGSKDIEFNMKTFDKTESIIVQQPNKSVLLITNLTDASYNREAVRRLKIFSMNITPYVKASTVVGVVGLKKVILQSIIRLTKRTIKICNSVEEAKQWLAEQ